MPCKEEVRLIKVLQDVQTYAIGATLVELKNLLQISLGLVLYFLRTHRLSAQKLKLLDDFIELEKEKPPHAIPMISTAWPN